jgi:hypothetical protein
MRCRAGSEPSTTAKSNWSGGSGASSAVVISGSFPGSRRDGRRRLMSGYQANRHQRRSAAYRRSNQPAPAAPPLPSGSRRSSSWSTRDTHSTIAA